MAVAAYPRVALLRAGHSAQPRVQPRNFTPQTTAATSFSNVYLPLNEPGNLGYYKDAGPYHQDFHLGAASSSVYWDPDFGGCLNFAHNSSGSPITSRLKANAIPGFWDVTSHWQYKYFLVSFWFKTSTNTQDIFYIQGTATGTSLIIVSIGPNALGGGSNNQICCAVRGEGNNLGTASPGVTVTDGAWHYCIAGFTDCFAFAMVDTTVATTSTSSTIDSLVFGSANPALGGYTHAYTGKLKNFRFTNWDSANVSDGRPGLGDRGRWAQDFFQVLPARRFYRTAAVGPVVAPLAGATIVAG